ncbi:MAG: hypothetical protein RLZZ385_1030 [Pseudomonadota bacterium]|jgi:putative copper resistance protein D
MPPPLGPWELAGLAAKLAFYIGLFCSIGSIAAPLLVNDGSRRFLTRNLLYGLMGSLVAFHGVLLFFLLQVGGIADDGLAGMLDWSLVSFYLQTPVGDASMARLAGLLLLVVVQVAALVYVGRRTRPPAGQFYRLTTLGAAVGLAVVVHSFRVSGHLVVESQLAQLALLFHVLAVGLWAGMLYPLAAATVTLEPMELKFALQRFSRLALGLVAVLLVSALIMGLALLESPAALWQSSYGQILLVKLLPVSGMLGLAALNKLRLTRSLPAPEAVRKLRWSIGGEGLLAVLVLAVTAVMSTVIGPPGH